LRTPAQDKPALGAWILFAAYTVLVIRGAIIPASDFPRFLAFVNDKVIHSIEYFLLFWISWNAFCHTSWQKYAANTAMIYALGMGVLTEILQIKSPSRTASWDDFGADCLGALLAFGILLWRVKNMTPEKS
jgi:VanZ family protein